MAPKFELPITQNSTIVAFLLTLALAVALSPLGKMELGKDELFAGLLRLAHLFCFAAWLGSQIWVTFFAGLTMYRILPRHTFGLVQSKLFSKYFFFGTVMSGVTSLTFFLVHPFSEWGWQEKVQGYSLALSFLMVLLNVVYFSPQTIRCTFQKHKFEKEVNAGKAIGKVEEDKVKELRKNPEYCVLEKRFTRLHTYSTIGNLVALALQAIHLWYLASNLNTV